MRFGGLVAVNDLSFSAARGDITALIGPNGAGKTTVFNCITGFYKPTEGRIALQFGDTGVWNELEALTERGTRSFAHGNGALFLLERMPDYLVTQKARVARTFQNIRLFPGMTVLENLLVAQHNALMHASGWTRARRVRRSDLRQGRARRDRQGALLARHDRPHRARRRSGRRTCPMARSAGSRSRARCAPTRCCSASTSRPPASMRTRRPSSPTTSTRIRDAARDVDPADRARHVGGDGNFRPHRRARPRRQDRRRHAARRSATTRR